MRVAVAAWVGSPNAGDELVHEGLRRHLADLGATAVVTSRTRLLADVAGRRVDGLVLGGGGLLQDETSALNLPYHLSPVLASRVPCVGVGLGAGPLTTGAGRAAVRCALRAMPVSVRDAGSREVLVRAGLDEPVVAADLAFNLPRPEVEVADVVVVSLRPWTARRHRLPVALRRGAGAVDPGYVDRAAAALDGAAARTGLAIRLVALEPPKDGPLLRAVAERLSADVEVVEPSPPEVPEVVATGQAVVAMRYHAGVAAALAARPVVLLGYSPKVGGLGGDLGARTLPWDLGEPEVLGAAVLDALARSPDVLEERLDGLRRRERRNVEVLERLLVR